MGSEQFSPEPLCSDHYQLTGKPDYILRTKEGLVPIEVKSRSQPRTGIPYLNHRLQLAAHCLLVEEAFGSSVPFGEIHYINQIIRVPFDDVVRAELLEMLNRIQASVGAEQHRSHRERARCKGCGHRGHCGEELI
jgi:CRISPR-associated exonuclease Cas4